jgi:hypothetical protein
LSLRTRRLTRLIAGSALIWLVGGFALCASANGLSNDQPRIIPWHQIGDVGIGMPRTRVLSEYGTGKIVAPDLREYRVRGGTLRVVFSKGRVAGVETNSRRYRTPGGFGVGSRIPLRPCECWNGFQLCGHEQRWDKTVTWNGHKFDASIYVDSNYTLVGAISFGRVY